MHAADSITAGRVRPVQSAFRRLWKIMPIAKMVSRQRGKILSTFPQKVFAIFENTVRKVAVQFVAVPNEVNLSVSSAWALLFLTTKFAES
jgi:hypothetical protein